jgi:hypothetical protein
MHIGTTNIEGNQDFVASGTARPGLKAARAREKNGRGHS